MKFNIEIPLEENKSEVIIMIDELEKMDRHLRNAWILAYELEKKNKGNDLENEFDRVAAIINGLLVKLTNIKESLNNERSREDE